MQYSPARFQELVEYYMYRLDFTEEEAIEAVRAEEAALSNSI